MTNHNDYPMGARVVFADANATTSTGEAGVASGVVNGPPMADDDDNVSHVPVWTERDNHREPTTVWVAVENIMEVKPHGA